MSRGKLRWNSSHASGKLKAGSSLSFWVSRNGNPDDVPDTGIQWSFSINGHPATHRDLQNISAHGVNLPHTFNRSQYGFLLREDWVGLLEVHGKGPPQLGEKRWAFQVEFEAQPDPPESDVVTRDDFARLENKVDQILTALAK